MRTKIGYGIFMWMAGERQTGRYGYVFMSRHDFAQKVFVEATLDNEQAESFIGKKVRLICKIVDTRKSGHVGDRFLSIKPSTPAQGEEIELGVGLFSKTEELGETVVGLEPNDGRDVNWVDPRVLYRLHDQTVELYAEETEDAFTPAPTLFARVEGSISLGDGSFQIRGISIKDGDKIKLKTTRLGGGLFSLGNDFEDGERVEVIRKNT